MPGGWKRRRRPTRRAIRSVGSAAGVAGPHASAREQELLDTVWEGLNIARDNKALVMVTQGAIININQLAAELFGCSLAELKGINIGELVVGAPTQRSAGKHWETTLKRSTGRPIPVEVTRQPLSARLSGVEVYAIRDLRERRQTAEQLQRQSKLLLQREEDLRTQNAILDAALSNMLQGLAMFDAEQRLIVCNRRYAEMYALTPEQVKLVDLEHLAVLYVETRLSVDGVNLIGFFSGGNGPFNTQGVLQNKVMLPMEYKGVVSETNWIHNTLYFRKSLPTFSSEVLYAAPPYPFRIQFH